jgi:modulator of FtsH protease HflC
MIRLVVVAAVAVIILAQSMFQVMESELALILRMGMPVRIVQDPGLYFKLPLIEDLTLFDKRILAAEARPAEYITLDKKRLTVDTVSRWKITDPLVFYRTVRNYIGATARLNDIISGRLRQDIANHDFKTFIREERENIMAQVTKEAANQVKPFGIEVIDVRIKRVDLPEEVQNSVFARMRAERERIAKRYRAEGEEKAREIRANAERDKEILLAEAYRRSEALRGEGDAEATGIYAEAYGKNEEFYSFSRHLEVYRKIFGQDTTLLLNPDSPLLRYLSTPTGTKTDPAEKRGLPAAR